MGDITQLITAIAALVTALGGATAAVIVAIRSGNAQARVASSRGANLAQMAQDPGNPESNREVLQGLDVREMGAVLDLIGRIPGAMPDSNSPEDQP